MSDFCDCCATNEEYVQSHLNWNVDDIYGHDVVANFTDLDWIQEARECRATWASNGSPVPVGEEKLAELLESVYGVA